MGDIVVYANEEGEDTHVGIVTEIGYDGKLRKKVAVMSKWGADGEYFHPVGHVPKKYGKEKEYWTDRKTL